MQTIIGTDIALAQQYLEKGEVVAIPTETVYGLAGNAFDTAAVLKIFKVKNRPFFDPLILHTDSVARIATFVTHIPDAAYALFEAFSPGPLTLLLPRKQIVPDIVTSGLENVAVRIPRHTLTLDLLRGCDFPLAAPSANPFGYISPTTAEHVAAQLGEKIPMILDGGACTVGVESTIVSFEGDTVRVHRLGGLAVEDLEKVVGEVSLQLNKSSNPDAPGQLKSHYAPRKQLVLTDTPTAAILRMYPYAVPDAIGYIGFRERLPDLPFQNQIILSKTGNFEEAAKCLFGAMRQLDAQENIKVIVAEKLPDVFLGRAINDRLSRAAAQ